MNVKKRLITGKIILLIAAILFIINVIVAIDLLTERIQTEKEQIISTGNQIKLFFQNEILLRENSIEILHSSSLSFLDKKSSLNVNVHNYLKSYPEKSGYIMTPLPGYGPTDSGSLTGQGPIPTADSLSFQEIAMAVSLSPIFKALILKDPDTPWVYYTSLSGFIYLYPQVETDEFFFTERLFEKDFIEGALPENNPDRKIFWSPLYLDEAGKGLMTTVSKPVYQNDKYLGSVSIDIHIDKLKRILDSYHIHNSSNHLVNYTGEDVLDPGCLFQDINPEEMVPEVLYAYGESWVSLYDLDVEGWYILLKTEKKDVYRYALEKTLPVFVILLFLSAALVFLYLLFNALRKVETLSTKDHLTGIWNRLVFDSMSEQNFAIAKRQNTTFGLISIDIDYFKKYNDTYGHLAGDRVLRAVTDGIGKQLTRKTDYFFRVGGEEFAILTLSNTESQLFRLLEKLRESVFLLYIPHEESPEERITISLGGYIVTSELNRSFDDAYQKADKALYLAKSRGKNCFEIYKDKK